MLCWATAFRDQRADTQSFYLQAQTQPFRTVLGIEIETKYGPLLRWVL